MNTRTKNVIDVLLFRMLRWRSVIRRACACGSHTVVASECDSCREKRNGTLQRAAGSSLPLNDAPSIVTEVVRSPG